MRPLPLLALFAVGCLPFVVEDREQSFPVGDETALDLLLEAGNATVRGVRNSDTLDLHTLVRCTSPNADPQVRLGFDEAPLALRIGNDNPHCWVDLFLDLPQELALSVEDASGNLDIGDIGGPVEIFDGSGNVRVTGVQGDVTIDDGSGNLTIEDIDGDVEIHDDSGNITVIGVSGVVTIWDDSGNITVFDAGDVNILEDGSGSVTVD